MKLPKILKTSKAFFQKQIKKFKKANKQEHKEIEKLDIKIQKLQEEEQNTQDHLVRNNKSMMRFWLVGLLVVFIGYISFKSLDILYLILTALIISIAMEAIISFFHRWLHRGLAIILSYVLLIIFVLSGFIFIIPFLLQQASAFLDIFLWWVSGIQSILAEKSLLTILENMSIPSYIKDSLLSTIGDPELLNNIQDKLQTNLSAIIGTSTEYAASIGSFAVEFLAGFFTFLGKMAVVLTLSVMFSIEKNQVIQFMANLWWGRKIKYLQLKIKRIYTKLWLRLKWQLILCIFIGLTMFIALLILSAAGLEIPQKASLAIIAGLLELIPYLWPLLWGVPAVIVVLLHNGPGAAGIMILVIFLIQRMENNVLIPIVMNKTLGINPITIFISMLLWGLIMWFVWVLLAVPIAVIITMFAEKNRG